MHTDGNKSKKLKKPLKTKKYAKIRREDHAPPAETPRVVGTPLRGWIHTTTRVGDVELITRTFERIAGALEQIGNALTISAESAKAQHETQQKALTDANGMLEMFKARLTSSEKCSCANCNPRYSVQLLSAGESIERVVAVIQAHLNISHEEAAQRVSCASGEEPFVVLPDSDDETAQAFAQQIADAGGLCMFGPVVA